MWPAIAAAQHPGMFSIDAQWTIAPTGSSLHTGTLRFKVSGAATKTPYGTIALTYATPTLIGSLTDAGGGCTAPSASLQMLSNGTPRAGVIAELDSTGTKIILRFSVRYNWNLQCPDGSTPQLAGYEAVGACAASSPCPTSAPAELPRIATDIYQLDTTGPNRPGTTLTLHARVSFVPIIPITSKLVNPNPTLIDAQGQLTATAASTATLTLDPKAAAIGAIADGMSKLLVVVDTKDPVTLTLATADGVPAAAAAPSGMLTSLTGDATIDMTPTIVLGGGAERSLVVAVYTPPAYFGAPSAAAERTVSIAIASADQTVTQSIVLARPPLVVVHGLAAAPGAWQVFRQQLAARGYPDTLNARRVWMTSYAIAALGELSPTLSNPHVQAIGGDIDHALASYRLRGLAAAQVDLVAHGIGGLIARGYERTLRTLARYATRDNYAAGPIHRLITIGTPHDGSEWGRLANAAPLHPLARLIASRLGVAGPTGLAGFAGLASGGDAYQRLGSTTIAGGTHAIGTTWAPDASASYAVASRLLDMFVPAETPETFFCEDTSDLIAAASSQLARRDAKTGGTLINGTVHADFSVADATQAAGGNDFAIVSALDTLLNEAQTTSRLPTTFAAPIARACATATPATATASASGNTTTIALTSPVAGQMIQDDPSQPLTLSAAISAPVDSLIFVVDGVGVVAAAPGATSATMTIGGDVRLGASTVSAIARTATGEIVTAQASVMIARGGQPVTLSVTPAAIALSDLNRVRHLTVLGVYSAAGAGGNATVTRDLTSPTLGTSYTLVSGHGIVDLSATGFITARTSGSAAIDVRNGALVERVSVTVACPAGPCLFVSPSTALASGGSVMRLHGGGFVAGTTISVGGVPVPAESISVIDEHTLEFIAPPAATPAITTPAAAIATAADIIVASPGSTLVLPAAVQYVAFAASNVQDPNHDSDLDGMPDRWEAQFGLHVLSADGDGDLDGDGISNAAEYAAGSHPGAVMTRYLAEGATGAFFSTSIALFNPGASHATVVLRFTTNAGVAGQHVILVPAGARRTIDASAISGLAGTSFSTIVDADQLVVVDRTMTWGGGYGSHADTAVITPSPFWFLAEGSTAGDFQSFYLLQNPQNTSVSATVTYLLPFGQPPIERTYTLPPKSRTTIAVDDESPALAATDVSAAISATAPIIVERAMYRSSPTRVFTAGHESAGVTSPATRWFLAEGATGSFFDLFILIANPNASPAEVRVEYLLSTGETHSKIYTLAPYSRFTIWGDDEQLPEGSGIKPLANVTVSSTITSVNHVPIVVERTMWWPGLGLSDEFWTEAHNSPGATETGTAWALAEGETGGPLSAETYILIANTSDTAGRVIVTLHFEDGTTAERTLDLLARSRTTVQVSTDFPEAIDRTFGTIVRALPGPSAEPPQLVVERAIYTSVDGEIWSGGTNAMGTRIP
jgi:triacylglycerol esterase/lipase EstA (alpha/beta hydrolase family)